jgi:hypothetical protein
MRIPWRVPCTFYDECEKETRTKTVVYGSKDPWTNDDQKEFGAQQREHWAVEEAAKERAELAFTTEYNRHFGAGAWAASGKEFPKAIGFHSRKQLRDAVYVLKNGHARPKINWRHFLWAIVCTGIAIWNYRAYPNTGTYWGGFLVLAAVFLQFGLDNFYPVPDRKLDRLVAWHANSIWFILLACVIAGMTLAFRGASGFGWLLLVISACYVTWYGLLLSLFICVLACGYIVAPIGIVTAILSGTAASHLSKMRRETVAFVRHVL